MTTQHLAPEEAPEPAPAVDPADEHGDLDAALRTWQWLFAPLPGATLGGVAR